MSTRQNFHPACLTTKPHLNRNIVTPFCMKYQLYERHPLINIRIARLSFDNAHQDMLMFCVGPITFKLSAYGMVSAAIGTPLTEDAPRNDELAMKHILNP